ncbi:MAG: FlhC family transcriptional regulator, partial [Burkholderiaceae bacterium]|nr:FlhC family transcriptional regulator [Burkholderiaceae bacterium]
MALADTRIRSLETARECVRLGARQRTIAWLTGLPTSFIFHNIYDAEHLPPRGRPPYTEDFIYRSSLKVQAEVGMFAAKYRLLTAEDIAPAQALITAFRHYRSVVHQPSFSFDEAFFVVSNLDGIWAASTRTLELGACRRCGCLHLLPRGAAPAAAGCPYCRPHRTDRAPARAPPPPDHTSPASGTDAEAVTVPAALEAQIRSLRTERIFEQLGAHPRVVATLTGASAPADRRSSSRHREGPTHIGRAVNLIRWGVAVKTVQRAQFSLVATAYTRLLAAHFEPADAVRAAFVHISAMFPTV